MTDIVLFHHAQGLTDGVRQFAGQLRAAGHQVTTPDLYEGQVFGSLPEGLAYAEQAGFGTILERGRLAAPGPARRAWSTPASRSASCPRSCSPRPGPAPAARCSSTPACRPPSSAPGPTACRCRSTPWRPTPSSPTRATSTPPATWSRRRATASCSCTRERAPVRRRQPGRLRPGRRGAAHRAGPRVPGPRRRGWRAMRVEPAKDAGERDMLGQYLDYQRATMLAKADGLTREQLARPHPPSTLTLAGLLYHLALVEENWMVARFAGRPNPSPGRASTGAPTRSGSSAPRPRWSRTRSASATGRPASAAARWPPRPRTWTSCPWPSGMASTSRCGGCCCTCWRRRPGTPGTPT